ncbi:uncharacterized protein LOC117914829 isoform X3 [Vitis riparia]|uniref:uncharacterized protein LOC117914829 isoform X3 n=1 Tax=Vitis riparia TaxID=96939 RepID=UPI00155AC60D|nr:uncharacterized protein LOC117914829 isoform X3 [Vitis riparia]
MAHRAWIAKAGGSEREMGEAPAAETLDLDTIRSRMSELNRIHTNYSHISDSNPLDPRNLFQEFSHHLQSRVNQILSQYSDVESLEADDLDAYLGHLKKELNLVESENAKISNEIEALTRTYVEDSNQLESDLEVLKHSVDFVASQGLKRAEAGALVDYSSSAEDQLDSRTAHGDNNFEDLDYTFKRFEAIEKIEDALTGLKVIDFEGNCIRLSLSTFIPNLEGLLCEQKIEAVNEPSELNHELLIEVMDQSMELKNVEIFPNDVYLGEIIDAAKSSRKLFSHMSILETRSSLEWFVRKVQDKIILCALRQSIVKGANKSRHSLEYLDRDEIIVAHMVGGVDAFIKVCQGWPVSNNALKLKSLKSSDQQSKGISLSFLCKVEEMANSLDVSIRKNISSFVDAIEEILVQQMQSKLHVVDVPGK